MSDSVEFRHLEYLVAIDEGKNFTRAAEKLYRSQPAISQQVRGLEGDIGFPIFVRRGRDGVEPTPAGELVLGWARTVLSERREIFAIARAIHRGEVPTLKMGFSAFVNATLLTTFRQSYSELFPKCEVVFSGGDSTLIMKRLTAGTLDCAILPCPIDDKMLDVITVAQSQLVVCMRADDPLAAQTHLDVHEIAPRTQALRVMMPTLFVLAFAGVAHAQGTMDFSGAQTLMGTFKTFAVYAGAVICFGGLIFAGIRMMSGRFQDAIPGLFGALFGAGVLGWGAGWIGSLTGQSM
jgi:DNA-binding transcriptional LysR family regulator